MGKVMIIEDDQDIRESLADLLASEGYEIFAAANGLDALSQLRGLKSFPDLIVLDIMMPVMDGPTFLRIQMQDPELSLIPVVVTSADPHAEAKVNPTQIRGFLRKPANLDQILGVIRKFCLPDEGVKK